MPCRDEGLAVHESSEGRGVAVFGSDVALQGSTAPVNDFAILLLGLSGAATIPVPALGITVGIAAPQIIDLQLTGSGGDLSWEFVLPASASGLVAWFQVVRWGGETNVIATEVW